MHMRAHTCGLTPNQVSNCCCEEEEGRERFACACACVHYSGIRRGKRRVGVGSKVGVVCAVLAHRVTLTEGQKETHRHKDTDIDAGMQRERALQLVNDPAPAPPLPSRARLDTSHTVTMTYIVYMCRYTCFFLEAYVTKWACWNTQALIGERDVYMANSILKADGQKTVAVVGMAHMCVSFLSLLLRSTASRLFLS